MATFITIQTQVADYLNRSLTEPGLQTQIKLAINTAVANLEKAWNYKHMEVRNTSLALALNGNTVTIPTSPSYKTSKFLFVIDGTRRYPVAKTSSWDAIAQSPDFTNQKGRPTVYATIRSAAATGFLPDQFLFRPTADKAYTFDLMYYKNPVELSADSDTNAWTDFFHYILRYATLVEMSAYLVDDERIPKWAALLQEAVTNIRNYERQEEFGSVPSRVKSSWVY